jgi:hypothetical protein
VGFGLGLGQFRSQPLNLISRLGECLALLLL